jgi:hypothetical protein
MATGSGMVNRYLHGGPMPFTFGSCPMCGGAGFKALTQTATIQLRLYFSPKDWRKLGISVNKPESSVVVIGYMSELSKLKRANHLLLVSDIQKYNTWKYQLASEPLPHGFQKDRYFIATLEQI